MKSGQFNSLFAIVVLSVIVVAVGNSSNITKILNETYDIEMEFEPKVAGKYPLTIQINDETIHEYVYVSGTPKTMDAVRLMMR